MKLRICAQGVDRKQEILEEVAERYGVPPADLLNEVRGVKVWDVLHNLERDFPEVQVYWGALEDLREETF